MGSRTGRLSLAVVVLPAVFAAAQALALGDDLEPKDVLPVIALRRLEIRKVCWDPPPAKPATSVKIDVTVGPTGTVTNAIPREPAGSTTVIDCIVAEVKKSTFPTTNKGGFFRWPFVFR